MQELPNPTIRRQPNQVGMKELHLGPVPQPICAWSSDPVDPGKQWQYEWLKWQRMPGGRAWTEA